MSGALVGLVLWYKDNKADHRKNSHLFETLDWNVLRYNNEHLVLIKN